MSEIIKSEIEYAIKRLNQLNNKKISEDRSFSHIIIKNYFGIDYEDQFEMITDGANDGSIDFVYYDDDDMKVIVGQSKYTNALDNNTILGEFDKMYSTVTNFLSGNTGMYNEKLKRALQNALDRLPDENTGNIEYDLFTTADIDINEVNKRITNTTHSFPSEAINVFSQEDIEKRILSVQESIQTVKEDKIKIDRTNNILHYETETTEGIMVNCLSVSISALYNKYASNGLFDLNIRKYIKNTMVDNGIKNTLTSRRDDFWFLNNGIIIACEDFNKDGDTIHLYNFSIVNGGQTTTLISTYKGVNQQEFYIPCKIIAQRTKNQTNDFFTKIAEATNSQKPIYARDLKSTAPEMVRLSRWLESEGIFLEIKRGIRAKGAFKYYIKNDELAQLILSMVIQRPGTSRSGKRVIFENNDIYNRIFKANYDKDIDKKGFVLDLIQLYDRYRRIEEKYNHNGLTIQQTEVFRNGKQIIFAILGIIYELANKDISFTDISSDPQIFRSTQFVYSKFISNYHKDDFDNKLERIILDIVKIVSEIYTVAFSNKTTSSVSNFFKTDTKYYDIINSFAPYLSMIPGDDIKAQMDIFKR